MSDFEELFTRADELLGYLITVQQTFSNRPEVGEEFHAIVNEMAVERLDLQIAISRVTNLFHGYPDLINGFNRHIIPSFRPDAQANERLPVIIASKHHGREATSAQASVSDSASRSTITTSTHPSRSFPVSIPRTHLSGSFSSPRASLTDSPTSSTTTTPTHPSSSLSVSIASTNLSGGATSAQASLTDSPTSSTTTTPTHPSSSLPVSIASTNLSGDATSAQASLTDSPSSSTTTTPTHPRRSSRLKRSNPATSQHSSPGSKVNKFDPLI